MLTGTPEDHDLLRRLKRREAQALADAFDRYGRLAYALLVRMVQNPSLAEDLVQETFLRVWSRAHLLDEAEGSLGAWLLTVARNRGIDYLRSVDQRFARHAQTIEGLDHPALFCQMDQDLLNADRARLLQSAFHKLNAQQKQVIELAYYQGLSQSEMAAHLNQPLGTVKTWVRSALKVLRVELEGVAS